LFRIVLAVVVDDQDCDLQSCWNGSLKQAGDGKPQQPAPVISRHHNVKLHRNYLSISNLTRDNLAAFLVDEPMDPLKMDTFNDTFAPS
jgi:hypothetical protein